MTGTMQQNCCFTLRKMKCTSFLMELLNDSEPKVRHTAIKTSIKKNNPEVINAVIENLG